MAKWNGMLALVLLPVMAAIAWHTYFIAIPSHVRIPFGLFTLAFAGVACGFNAAVYFATRNRGGNG